jgi:hypothetical protein
LIVPSSPKGHGKIQRIILRSAAFIVGIGRVVKASELLGINP